MHKAEVAEWVLSLVVSQERAAAIVGDLMESDESSGRVSFWCQIARTVVSMLWNGIAGNPRWMLGLAFRGMLVEFGLTFLYFVPLMILQYALFRGLLPERAVSIIRPLSWLASLAAEFQAGRWLARRAPGRELAACLWIAFAWILATGVGGIVYEAYKGQWRFDTVSIVVGGIDPLMYLADLTALTAGAILVRRKSLRVIAG